MRCVRQIECIAEIYHLWLSLYVPHTCSRFRIHRGCRFTCQALRMHSRVNWH